MRIRVLIPPFIVGACLAGAGSISAGLLLYSGAGFLQATAAIVATLLVALALGVWTGYGGPEGDPVERVRRLWLFTLFAFTLAVVFSGAWEVLEELSVGRGVQATGLAVLGAFPLFAGGALLGAMARPDTVLGPGPGSRFPGAGSAALAGGALGVILSAVVLFPSLSPTAMLLLAVVALSGAALFHGRMLDSRFLSRVVEQRWTPDGEFRVVDEVRGRPRALRRVLLQNGVLRGAEDESGAPVRGVDRTVAEVLEGRPDGGKVLFLGGGAFTIPRRLGAGDAPGDVVVVEPCRALAAVAEAHFPVGRAEEAPRPYDLRHGHWWDAPDVAGKGYDAVVVDVGALFSLTPVSGLVDGGLERLASLLRQDGELLLAGVRPGILSGHSAQEPADGVEDPLEPLLEEARRRFGTVQLRSTEPTSDQDEPGPRPSVLVGDRRDVLVLAARGASSYPSGATSTTPVSPT